MASLQKGMSGDEVTALQKQLLAHGFPPGKADGKFGGGTEGAVIAFQKSEGLKAAGVADQGTLDALNAAPVPPPLAVPGVTVAIVSQMFPDTHPAAIRTHLPPVLTALADKSLTDKPVVLCALATIRAETEGFVPINEFVSRFNTSPSGHQFDLYDNRKDLGNRGEPDGASFKGRGFVQLTGRANYTTFGPIVGVPNLVDAPDQANDPVIAAKILAAFINSKADRIRTALAGNDLAAARKLVNGGSHGLDKFSSAYQIGFPLIP